MRRNKKSGGGGLFRRNKDKSKSATAAAPSTLNDDTNEDADITPMPDFPASLSAWHTDGRAGADNDTSADLGRTPSSHFRQSLMSQDSSSLSLSQNISGTTERPSYRVYGNDGKNKNDYLLPESEDDDDDDIDEVNEDMDEQHDEPGEMRNSHSPPPITESLSNSTIKSKHIESSAGTHRLNRILSKQERGSNSLQTRRSDIASTSRSNNALKERVHNPRDLEQVALFTQRVVIPPLKVEKASIGGAHLHQYPSNMQQETLACFSCQQLECNNNNTGVNAGTASANDAVNMRSLQYPLEYHKHKRSLGLLVMGSTGAKGGRNKLKYVIIARSTNKVLLPNNHQNDQLNQSSSHARANANSGLNKSSHTQGNDDLQSQTEGNDYDAMFAPDDDGNNSTTLSDIASTGENKSPTREEVSSKAKLEAAVGDMNEPEVSSFPVLVCMTLRSDGTGPDIRKLVPLSLLTTVQNVHATGVQLAFSGDTVRLEFSEAMEKDRFLWTLLQVHAMLCVSVAERSTMTSNAAAATTGSHIANSGSGLLPPLNVRNIDRAELQYMATVNGFLRDSPMLCALLDRQRALEGEEGNGANRSSLNDTTKSGEAKESHQDIGSEIDGMAYALMMGNFATRIALFQTEEEQKDSEEILNAIPWTDAIHQQPQSGEAAGVAERLGYVLQSRMRDLEAETCRRLIAWEDEKHMSGENKQSYFSATDTRDTVDALALASLFKTLESLDSELHALESWLQDRAGAIKPLTDDCADIEEENRQLEQQCTSYELLGAEMRRLLQGLDLDENMEKVLKNPASALVYDEEGRVDVEESEVGVEQIYDAGKMLQEAIEYPRRSGGTHLKSVSERAEGLVEISNGFCTSLAQIIVTVMEQFKMEVVAGSDYGKVSKSDTHSMIAKKIRDTQRKFQSALLAYIKLIEILAALNPEMLPALRDAYAEMVAEGILMKKRCKGYFQALPGKNTAYMNRAGRDLKDYIPHDDRPYERVNAPDIRATLSELLPVIAREAYFVSALFGVATKDQDGREKKRNFENARAAVDYASQHFRYYVNRTCGIIGDVNDPTSNHTRGDALLCLVASIYLNEAMDNYIDRDKKGGDHSLSLAYVRATILDLRKRADRHWINWVERQIAWIKSHDGVPLSGKRAGVFPSFQRFPCYLDHVIECCRQGRDEDYQPDMANIKVVNYYLQKIAASLIESLRECASRDTTDKSYASLVMIMENSYYFAQSIKDRGPIIADVFHKQVLKANQMCKESTDAYLGFMIKREFTGLHELFSRVSKVRQEHGDREVMNHVPKNQFTKVLNNEADRRVLRDKIGSMYSRMEKHISAESGLLPVAWKALVKVLFEWFSRWEKLSSTLYRHKLVPTATDVFKIAKAAGGAVKTTPNMQGPDFGIKSILALGNKGPSSRPSI